MSSVRTDLLTLFVVPVAYTLLDDFVTVSAAGAARGTAWPPAPAPTREPEPVAAD